MVGHQYTEEEHSFLRSYIPGHTYREIVEAYNERFAEPITKSRVKSYIGNYKLNTGRTGQFEKGHVPYNKGLKRGSFGRMAQTQFKTGHMPHNTKPLGYERITKDGYVEVKIKMRPSHPNCNDNFKAKHRIVWEEANGPIPEGYKVIFLDGDKRNVSLSNLALVSNAEKLQMTRLNLHSNNREITKTGVLIARAGVITNKKRSKK